MRYVRVLGVILVAWAVLIASDAVAKGPSSGGNSNGGNSGQNGGNWGSKSGNGGNWQWGSSHPYHSYGYGYGYYPGVPYVAERPIYENPPLSGLPIKITNPAANGVTLNYTLNGTPYTIPPGYSQQLVQDRSWVIAFSRGANFGEAQYGLEPGVYSFSSSDHGWELFRGPLAQTGTAGTPSNPTPPVTSAPANPAPKP